MPDLQLDAAQAVTQDDAVVSAAQKLSLEDETSGSSSPTDPPRSTRPILMYTRPQILSLYHSPLVKALDDMPNIKDWFGSVSIPAFHRLFFSAGLC
jgi:hypothetical protein